MAKADYRPEKTIDRVVSDAELMRDHVRLLELSDPNHPRRNDMSERVVTYHWPVVMRLQEVQLVIDAAERLKIKIRTPYGSFSSLLFELATRGIPRSDLDNRLSTIIFGAVASVEGRGGSGESRYHFEFNDPVNVGQLVSMSSRDAFQTLIADIYRSLNDERSRAKKDLFEREVLQKLYLLKLVSFEPGEGFGGGPAGGNIGPDKGGGAGVPRRPIPPQLVGSAENEIPEPTEPGAHHE